MDGKEMFQGLQDAFLALDKVRERASEDLVEAANKALGAKAFKYARFARDSGAIEIHLVARIPCENPSDFWDGLVS